jgi:cytosine/adenosine deaminase-related metal-dependent hydrolase
MQSLASQVSQVWNEGKKDGLQRQAVAARDYMIVRVLGHELIGAEEEEQKRASEDSERILSEWEAHGGLSTGVNDAKIWVGVDPPS